MFTLIRANRGRVHVGWDRCIVLECTGKTALGVCDQHRPVFNEKASRCQKRATAAEGSLDCWIRERVAPQAAA